MVLLALGLTAELREVRSEALQLSSFKQKKEEDPFTRGGRAGLHCKIVVMNGSQRCEMHNLALFRWVGWAWSVCRVAVAILVKSDSARTFEECHGLFSARAPSANGGERRLAQVGQPSPATLCDLALLSQLPVVAQALSSALAVSALCVLHCMFTTSNMLLANRLDATVSSLRDEPF